MMTQTKMQDLNALSLEIYEENKIKGFWDDVRSIKQCKMLIITEFAEAIEALRNGDKTWAKSKDVDELLLNFDVEKFKLKIKDTASDEICDATVRILDLCGFLNLNIDYYVVEAEKSKYEPLNGNLFEDIYDTIETLFSNVGTNDGEILGRNLAKCLCFINTISIKYEIRLFDHVTLKRKYNKTRPFKHGKKS